ncbi:putative small auxin-up RNA [Helianthus anomalus]
MFLFKKSLWDFLIYHIPHHFPASDPLYNKPPSHSTLNFSHYLDSQHLSMAKGGKLTKIKSVLKKWRSFSNGEPVGLTKDRATTSDHEDDYNNVGHNSHAVYVGKSRRRYLISSEVAQHPLFQELVERSGVGDSGVTIECEVVLFEHLLWMIENADPQPDALHELVDFYACS